MVTLLLLTWLQATPAQPAPQPARPRATTTSAPSTTLSITVTDSVGAVLENATVTLLGGAVDREGTTGADGRVRRVHLTREGRALQRKLVPVAERLVARMTAGIDDRTLSATRGVLRRMFDNLSP